MKALTIKETLERQLQSQRSMLGALRIQEDAGQAVTDQIAAIEDYITKLQKHHDNITRLDH